MISNLSALNQSLLVAIGFTRPSSEHDVLNYPGFDVYLDNNYNTISFFHRLGSVLRSFWP